jgi:RNA-binding protein YlmH
VRDRIGDILVQGEGGAQVLVDAELAEHFEAELTQVRSSQCGDLGLLVLTSFLCWP